jgi:hypothetical protein
MKEHGWIEPIVERVVGQVLESHIAQLRREIVRRVMEEVATEPGSGDADFASPSSDLAWDLARAVSEIQLGTSQREILRALLDASSRYATRVALFVVKGSRATGWQGRGFANNDAIKDFALDENAPALTKAIGDRIAANVPSADMDSRFFQEIGAPASGEARLFPLILKDKVAALVYADSGTGASGLLDAGSLELLVLSTSAWLEVNSLRKQAHKEPSAAYAENPSLQAVDAPTYSAPAHSAPAFPAFNDPFASHTPAYAPVLAKAAAASAGDGSAAIVSESFEAPAFDAPAVEVPALDSQPSQTEISQIEASQTLTSGTEEIEMTAVESESATSPWPSEVQSAEVQSAIALMEPAPADPLPIGYAEPAFTPPSEPPPAPAPSMSPEDQEIHRKAQRFARLLVDEIKLYNQARVTEGRQNRDLYDRLKEVIGKSRATYQKRYGNTVAASANYFEHEIISSLAEDDPSIMGANFRQ